MISTQDTTYVEVVGGSLPGQGDQVVQTSKEYVDYSAGVVLEIMPHISDGDLLRLEIDLIRSDFGAASSVGGPPDTSETTLNTVVTVPDKSTIILGGMTKINQTKSGGKVPILGDLPLIGGLFRSHSKSDLQKKLYIFVKAEVIRPEETLNEGNGLVELSMRNRRAFEEDESEFQGFEGWPGIKARAMGPEGTAASRKRWSISDDVSEAVQAEMASSISVS